MRYSGYLPFESQTRGLTLWEVLIQENHKLLGWGIMLPGIIVILSGVLYYGMKDKEVRETELFEGRNFYFHNYVQLFSVSLVMVSLNTLGIYIVGAWIGIGESVDISVFSKYLLIQYATVFGIAAIQNCLFTWTRNGYKAMKLGFFGWIIAVLLFRSTSTLMIFWPYAHSLLSKGIMGHNATLSMKGGVITAVMFYIIGAARIRKGQGV